MQFSLPRKVPSDRFIRVVNQLEVMDVRIIESVSLFSGMNFFWFNLCFRSKYGSRNNSVKIILTSHFGLALCFIVILR